MGVYTNCPYCGCHLELGQECTCEEFQVKKKNPGGFDPNAEIPKDRHYIKPSYLNLFTPEEIARIFRMEYIGKPYPDENTLLYEQMEAIISSLKQVAEMSKKLKYPDHVVMSLWNTITKLRDIQRENFYKEEK